MSLRFSSVNRSTRARQHARNRRRRLWLEGTESRVLLSGNPTYYTVNLTSDCGASSGTDAYPTAGTPSGDLLWAVTQANANTNAAGSVIDFDPTVFATLQTITLSSTLVLSESAGPEVVDGPSGSRDQRQQCRRCVSGRWWRDGHARGVDHLGGLSRLHRRWR